VSELTLTVLGAGVMGTNIATTALGHGVPVTLVDVDRRVLERARVVIAGQLRHANLLGAFPAGQVEGTLRTTTVLADAMTASAVVEAVTEDVGVKQKVLAEVSDRVRPGTPLVSNTSGIPIDGLADHVARPGELVGMHFMNPSYLIRMVEVIRGPRTTGSTMDSVAGVLSTLGRQGVVVGDAPGFVTSRLLHPMINDAIRIVAQGVATVEAVDSLMHGCLGHPTGPLRTADLIGLDNLADSLLNLYQRTGDECCLPAELLVAKVRAGDLGRKSGCGFYTYEGALS
jgi:methoxymalonate biosynthesis protein